MAEVVDGLTWTRSKPDLRMYREMFGMSTAEFGRRAAGDGRTVRAWENPREWVPDRTAWMAVESLWRDAERMASGLVPEAGADPVVLPYGTGAATPACVAARLAAGRRAAAGRPCHDSISARTASACAAEALSSKKLASGCMRSLHRAITSRMPASCSSYQGLKVSFAQLRPSPG